MKICKLFYSRPMKTFAGNYFKKTQVRNCFLFFLKAIPEIYSLVITKANHITFRHIEQVLSWYRYLYMYFMLKHYNIETFIFIGVYLSRYREISNLSSWLPEIKDQIWKKRSFPLHFVINTNFITYWGVKIATGLLQAKK